MGGAILNMGNPMGTLMGIPAGISM